MGRKGGTGKVIPCPEGRGLRPGWGERLACLCGSGSLSLARNEGLAGSMQPPAILKVLLLWWPHVSLGNGRLPARFHSASAHPRPLQWWTLHRETPL